MKIVQMGCNNGDDEIYQIVKSENVEFALLIDANPYVLELAKERYKSYETVKIECYLISDKEIEMDFLIPHFESHRYSQHSSLSKDHIIKHGHKLEDVKILTIKSITPEKLFEMYNLYYIDYLYIDCEGEDFNILNNIDFNKFDIKKITFEHAHIPDREKNYPYILSKLKTFGFETVDVNLGNITLKKL